MSQVEASANQNGLLRQSTGPANGTCSKQPLNASSRPKFEDLPLKSGDPKASAWGLWGDGDELGTLNLLTPEVVRAAVAEVQLGQTVPLNLPLDCPLVPMNPRRKPCSHNIISKGYANDDELDINTQGSSHWDGLRHYPYQNCDPPRYYNGTLQEDITGDSATERIGIQNVARRGIAGRAVLLDWRSWAIKRGVVPSPFSTHRIPLSDLKAVAKEQGVQFVPGDILIIRSGWTEEYMKLDDEGKIQLAKREDRSFIGVEDSCEMIEWHWDMQFSAVAGDTNAYEAWPPTRAWDVCCHEVFLSGWGMPIGELWDLEGLAQMCKETQRWSFFLTSCPLNIPKGVASPPNAMAIF
jgi:kynurenine formamidase